MTMSPWPAAPPHVALSWTATSLTTTWAGYRIYRRRSAGIPEPWHRIAEIVAPTGITATNAEAYFTNFRDYTASWSPTGWDYYVAAVRNDGVESVATGVVSDVNVTQDNRYWLVSNAWPELAIPLDIVDSWSSSVANRVQRFEALGRDRYITASRTETPGKTRRIEAIIHHWSTSYATGDELVEWIRQRLYDPTRRPQAWTLLGPNGDVVRGTVQLIDISPKGKRAVMGVTLELTETGSDNAELDVGWQGPSQLRFGASGTYIDHGTSILAIESTQPFTVLLYAALRPVTVGTNNKGLLSQYVPGTGMMAFYLDSSKDLLFRIGSGPNDSIATETSRNWDDNVLRVYGGRRDVTTDRLGIIIDGTIRVTTPDTSDFILGGPFRVGTWSTSYIEENVVAYAVWHRSLSTTELTVATEALKGTPGFSLPYGTVLAVDMRRPDSYPGDGTTVYDLSGNNRHGTLAGTNIWMPRGTG